ncbi:flagellar protein export ATPase FliI [Niveispirillum sp. KHB5.9]|uniref:flagellar protein export ATPase FliI n=1 Tax=Niveispirillum sp. KHB5.9 TaxID=3400269 RepID=UPI003A86B133
MLDHDQLLQEINGLPAYAVFGRVTSVLGMMVEVGGVERRLSIGGRCRVITRGGKPVPCEVVGFRSGRALLMPFGTLDDIGLGCRAEVAEGQASIYPTQAWLGRVINALGQPIDGKGPLPQGETPILIKASPPPAHARKRVGAKMDLGVKSINTFLSCCRGQRMGIFAGSGVGKSVLMSMLAKYTEANISVIGLIGERGREVQEFLEHDLGPEGIARSVVIVATSDEPPLMRRQAAYMTFAVSEFFRDQEQDVLCLMDSVTRFAMAQREIGLSAGEPPTTKGYPPTVFAELPRLLERAGPGTGKGTISGLFTVLVEGGDMEEPIADAVRGILDGHIVMERRIGERGRYPAINILRSVSRTMPGCNTPEQNALVGKARRLMSAYSDMEEMIRLGAYRKGNDPQVDEAIHYNPAIEAFLRQGKGERSTLDQGYAELAAILGSAG